MADFLKIILFMKKIFFIALLWSFVSLVMAQDNTNSDNNSESTAYRYTPSPDFPGALVFDWGINYFDKNSGIMDTKPWSSPTLNVYYMYDHRIGDSRFSVNFGAGVGNEKYTFNSNVTFVDTLGFTKMDSIANVPFFSTAGGVKKTQMVINYIDIPLEFRVHSRKNDHKRAFYLALGGKIGFRFAGKTKVVYSEFGNTKKTFNLFFSKVKGVNLTFADFIIFCNYQYFTAI